MIPMDGRKKPAPTGALQRRFHFGHDGKQTREMNKMRDLLGRLRSGERRRGFRPLRSASEFEFAALSGGRRPPPRFARSHHEGGFDPKDDEEDKEEEMPTEMNSEDVAEIVDAAAGGSSMSGDRCLFLGFVGAPSSATAAADDGDPKFRDFQREDLSLDRALIDCNRIRNQRAFREGLLLRCIEPKAMFPFLHLATFGAEAFDDSTLCSSFDSNSRSLFGTYEELFYIHKSTSFLEPALPTHRHAGFIISSFKLIEKSGRSSPLEKSWLTWTAAREIYKFSPRNWNLRRISLLRIRNSQSLQTPGQAICYVLLCEFGNILHPSNTIPALEMVNRLRIRKCGEIALYSVQYNFGPASTIPLARPTDPRVAAARSSAATIWPAPHVSPRSASAVQRFGSLPTREKMLRGFNSQDVIVAHNNEENTAARRRALLARTRDRSLGYQDSPNPVYFRSYQFEEFA